MKFYMFYDRKYRRYWRRGGCFVSKRGFNGELFRFIPTFARAIIAVIQEKTFVVSGVFEMSRNELKKLIEDNGGKVPSSISPKTSFLIAGDNMGSSKRAKAEGLGITMISEQEFLKLL